MVNIDLDAALQQLPTHLLELGKNYDSRTDFSLHTTEWLTHIYPQFIQCTTYTDRIDFFEKYNLLDYLTLNCTNSVDQFHYKGVFALGPEVPDWESMINTGCLTLTPLTDKEVVEFIDWALLRRPTMRYPIYVECAPHSSEMMIKAFYQRFTTIKSSLDRDDFLLEKRRIALAWKNLSSTDGLYELHYIPKGNGQTLQVHLQLYSQLMTQLKWGKPIRLTDYYKPGQLFISWSIIDTYLLAKANYEFALFLEEFNSSDDLVPSIPKQQQPVVKPNVSPLNLKQMDPKVTPYYPGLTIRENILIICYEAELVISKGQPDYNDYITYCTKEKRLAYSTNSQHKLRSLIASIQKIQPYLSEKARKRADDELTELTNQRLN